MTTRAKHSPSWPPVLLPRVRVVIDSDRGLTVTVGKDPWSVPAQWVHGGHDAVPVVIDEVSRQLACPFRLEIADEGLTFTDIVTPSDPSPSGRSPSDHSPRDHADQHHAPCATEVAGSGFSPDEDVAVAIVVAHRSADIDGVARLRLPPSLIGNRPGPVVLFGLTSGAIAVSGSTT